MHRETTQTASCRQWTKRRLHAEIPAHVSRLATSQERAGKDLALPHSAAVVYSAPTDDYDSISPPSWILMGQVVSEYAGNIVTLTGPILERARVTVNSQRTGVK
jgi:hypothetical protein